MEQISPRKQRTTLSDINVTPLVDVTMVLLIIFMVAAPLIEQGVKVDLPKTRAPTIDSGQNRLVLTIKKDRTILLGEREIPFEQLRAKLEHNELIKRQGELYLHADRTLDYGYVVDVMARVQGAGVTKLGMITDSNVVHSEEGD